MRTHRDGRTARERQRDEYTRAFVPRHPPDHGYTLASSAATIFLPLYLMVACMTISSTGCRPSITCQHTDAHAHANGGRQTHDCKSVMIQSQSYTMKTIHTPGDTCTRTCRDIINSPHSVWSGVPRGKAMSMHALDSARSYNRFLSVRPPFGSTHHITLHAVHISM